MLELLCLGVVLILLSHVVLAVVQRRVILYFLIVEIATASVPKGLGIPSCHTHHVFLVLIVMSLVKQLLLLTYLFLVLALSGFKALEVAS